MSLDLIVEIGNVHEGSLGIATSMVDMAAQAGARTVKFQMHLAENESTLHEPFRKKFSLQDKTRFDYWKRVSFSFDHWKLLIDYVSKAGLEFMCSPFSLEAAKWLSEDGRIQRWKVGSGEATNYPLIDYMIETELPILLSTGLVTWNELLDIKSRFESKNAWNRVTLLHCVSMYPAPIKNISLSILDEFRKITDNIGYSDHSGNLAVPLYVLASGIKSIEVHMTPHPLFFGPDTKASLTPEEIATLVQTARVWEVLETSGSSRDELFASSSQTATIFRKGVYWKRDLKKGDSVSMDDIAFLKPSSHLEAKDYESVLGRIVSRDVWRGSAVSLDEISE